jgi:hypothetical protein
MRGGREKGLATLMEVGNLAWLLAYCATLAGKDATVTFFERPVLVQIYANQAMEELRQVRAHGKLSADELRKGIVFEPLRSRNDFQQLLIELDKSSQSGK